MKKKKISESEMYVVKVKRSSGSSIMFCGTSEEARAYARNLNTQYQTDEYRVEKYKLDGEV